VRDERIASSLITTTANGEKRLSLLLMMQYWRDDALGRTSHFTRSDADSRSVIPIARTRSSPPPRETPDHEDVFLSE
jgi:hypothetical protein